MLPTGADEQATIVCQIEVGGVWVGSMEAYTICMRIHDLSCRLWFGMFGQHLDPAFFYSCGKKQTGPDPHGHQIVAITRHRNVCPDPCGHEG